MKKILIIITLFSISFSAFAGNKCETCLPLEKLAKANFREKETVKKSQDLLMSFELSNDSEIRPREIRSYLKLALKAVQADGTAIADEYFYNFYSSNRKEFNIEIRKMKDIDRKIIIKSLKNIGEVRKSDGIE